MFILNFTAYIVLIFTQFISTRMYLLVYGLLPVILGVISVGLLLGYLTYKIISKTGLACARVQASLARLNAVASDHNEYVGMEGDGAPREDVSENVAFFEHEVVFQCRRKSSQNANITCLCQYDQPFPIFPTQRKKILTKLCIRTENVFMLGACIVLAGLLYNELKKPDMSKWECYKRLIYNSLWQFFDYCRSCLRRMTSVI